MPSLSYESRPVFYKKKGIRQGKRKNGTGHRPAKPYVKNYFFILKSTKLLNFYKTSEVLLIAGVTSSSGEFVSSKNDVCRDNRVNVIM